MALDGSLATCSMNQSQLEQVGFWKTSFPSADYWRNIVLEKSESIEYSGEIVWHLVLSLFAIHLIVYFLLIKGIKVSGKAVYFTALFPYFVLVILGIRGWFLPGAEIGIKFYLTPKWKKLMDIRVWIDGATTVFFSLGISYGGMSTLASYNKFDADIMRAAILVPLVNCLTSFFAGFVIFAYMGYLCQLTGQGIDDIIEAGQGLAFVVYPYAVTTLVGAPIWSVLFFFMLCLLGISSQVANIQVTITSILEGLPILQATNKRKYLTITAILVIYFLISLIFTLQSGTYWVEILNAYSGDWGILVIGAAECIIVSYLYGLKNFRNDIEVMLGSKYAKGIMFNIWVILWAFISPAFCLIVAIIAFTKLKNINIGDNVFPDWTLYLGQTIQIGVIFGLFGGAVYFIVFDSLINKKKTLVDLFKPNFDEYIPKNECDRIRVKIKRGLEIGEINENFISKIKLVQEE